MHTHQRVSTLCVLHEVAAETLGLLVITKQRVVYDVEGVLAIQFKRLPYK